MANQKLLKKVAPVVLSAAMAMTSMPTVAMAADFSDSDVVSDAVEVEETPDAETETEVEVDTETGSVEVLDYVAVVDCGTPINPNLARVQTEGGIAQGIGMALSEDIQYTDKGKVRNNSFMQYKIPTRQDIGNIRVAFESSYEKSGPFGAKSIGELVIDTPCPALAEAIYNATGVRLTELPMTPEKIAMGILKNKSEQ